MKEGYRYRLAIHRRSAVVLVCYAIAYNDLV